MKSTKQPEATEKPTTQPEGSERHRDEQRTDGGPRYGGEDWKVADERGDNRFGHARNDDADPEDDEDATTVESSGQHVGMGRGEKPRISKDREP